MANNDSVTMGPQVFVTKKLPLHRCELYQLSLEILPWLLNEMYRIIAQSIKIPIMAGNLYNSVSLDDSKGGKRIYFCCGRHDKYFLIEKKTLLHYVSKFIQYI